MDDELFPEVDMEPMPGDPVAEKLKALWEKAQETIPNLEQIAHYVANRGEQHCIIAAAPTTTELEDGTVLRRRIPVYWGLEKDCYDMIEHLSEITDWTLSVH